MDPATGASTCALGSHRCTEYMGNFTKNPAVILKVKIGETLKKKILSELGNLIKSKKKYCPQYFINAMFIKSRGKEAQIVYNTRFSLALKRSGWYPHPIIIMKIGNSAVSNKK
jgi:hypothetical protein